MERFGIPVEFVGGRRVTTKAGLAVVRSSFAAVNRALCSALGTRAVGLLGDEIGLHAVQIPGLGRVGDPLPSRPHAVVEALLSGRIPVIAPLGVGPLNVNADDAAAALAVGLEADRLLFVTDVAGVFHDGSMLTSIGAGEADRLLGDGTFDGGIVPKLRAAMIAVRNGVRTEIGETAVVA
jgi:acetylglutamate kinase